MSQSRRTTQSRPWGLQRAATLVLALAVSACSTAIALGSPSHWWLAWLALPPLFFAIRVLPPLYAMVSGGIWGVSLYVLSVTTTISPFAPSWQSLLLLAAVPAIYAFAGSTLTRGIGYSALFLAVGWIGLELALKPLSLEQGILAGTQGHGAFSQVIGGAFGYGLVAFVVAFANGLLVRILCDLRFQLPHLSSVLVLTPFDRVPVPVVAVRPNLADVGTRRPRGPPTF